MRKNVIVNKGSMGKNSGTVDVVEGGFIENFGGAIAIGYKSGNKKIYLTVALKDMKEFINEIDDKKPRAEVIKYADAMEIELKENDHKGGWKGVCDLEFLTDKLDEEVAELKAVTGEYQREECAVLAPNHELALSRVVQKVRSEAADVGNIAMMIADICDAL